MLDTPSIQQDQLKLAQKTDQWHSAKPVIPFCKP